ncbi:THUMP domain-containing protein 2-like isoform X2 [Corticium candelabrum]|uniref:THUMP domain-containing protein 2-like isoform X2 n=1 Tax=Corticium candelabrum TaxID=121492 RepID=UPI002E253893|nr:THUMP domain-containing protein 2-like isoform X2 [Corticium candelabrum]
MSEHARFLCTAGRGMEEFVKQDVIDRCHAYNVKLYQGKVAFSSNASPEHLIAVKSAERLMVLVTLQSSSMMQNKEKKFAGSSLLSSLVNTIVTDDVCMWRHAVTKWREFQRLWDGSIVEQEITQHGSPAAKRMKPEGMYSPSAISTFVPVDQVSFRVSCKCAGRLGRQLSCQELAKAVGYRLGLLMSWKVNLKSPDVEVCVHVNDDLIIAAIPTTRVPLSSRSYLKTFGLRCTVAWAIGRLANIKPGDVVMDPMCGSGILLIESAREWKDAVYVGCDLSDSQLFRAVDNVKEASPHNVFLMEANATHLPVVNDSVDVVICDLPFGQQHGIPETINKLYTLFAKEVNRVLKSEGTLVLLTSTANIEILLQGFNKCTCIRGDGSCLEFCVTENYPVVLGILPACIVVLKQKLLFVSN